MLLLGLHVYILISFLFTRQYLLSYGLAVVTFNLVR